MHSKFQARRQTLLSLRNILVGPAFLSTTSVAFDTLGQNETNHPFHDLTLSHSGSQRSLSIRVRLPLSQKKSPLIIYSPGLGSGISNGQAWCIAWQKAGYVVITISHPISNDSIWDTTHTLFLNNMHESIASPQYDLRVKDCQFVITQALLPQALQAPELRSLSLNEVIDPDRIGIAGHSFGALTVQSISGQSLKSQIDPRIKAAIALSPGAMTIQSAKKMSAVKIPFFCIMGDHDNYVTFKKGESQIRLGMPLEKRKTVFDYLPKGQRQLLIIHHADHMSFAGEAIDSNSFSRDINNELGTDQATWDKVSNVTTTFWNRYLLQTNSNINLDPQKNLYKNEVQKLLSPQDISDIS